MPSWRIWAAIATACARSSGAVGRGDDADVERHLLVAAHRPQRALLEGTQ
jgi:hypothetical protein